MADLNMYSSRANTEYRKGSVTASRIQPYDVSATYDPGFNIGNAYIRQNTMYLASIQPKTTNVTIDGVAMRAPGMVGGSQVDITGKKSSFPTDVPGIGTYDENGCVFWTSDGTSPYGANGDIYASRRLTSSGSLTHACLSPFTRLYSDIETGSDGTVAADGSENSLGVSLASLPPGTYLMSYSFSYVPNTAYDARVVSFWVQGSFSSVLPNSISGHDQATGADRNAACVSWIQTLTATDTLTLMGKYDASGANTITIESTSYPTVLLAVRIA